MSKLDRFLVTYGLLSLFPHVSAACLDRHLSDHRPILLREDDPIQKDSYKILKKEIRVILDQGGVNDDLLLSRTECMNNLQDVKAVDARDSIQKAKIQWAVEGDENSKFFYVLNSMEAIRRNFFNGTQDDERKITWVKWTKETKMENISNMDVKFLWGNSNFDFIFSEALGNSGGILCAWDHNVFRKEQHIISDNFVALYGTWSSNKMKILLISVYAPQAVFNKRVLWTYLTSLINRWNGASIVMGDFNEVWWMEELWGSNFNVNGAHAFNNFIYNSGLVDLQLEGYTFTWAHPSATKMSKLDRFLVTYGLLSLFPHVSAACLDRHLSDHRAFLSSCKADDARDSIQKAKIQWAVEGDENSKFFHGIGLMTLAVIKTNSTELESSITREEIRNAVWGCGENKSPGPDGFTFEFFRKFWSVVGPDFCTAVEWFFDHASFSIGCNSSFIALIPKSLDPKSVGDYRPISLIGSMYKVITKILTTRLSVVIYDLISDVQTAFLSNRQILDGPFIINELLALCHHKKQRAMVFKFDFAKAYDSIR
ncbi:RNA-directed DNA polymerase, eukaryota [Tanacetum coccineum]